MAKSRESIIAELDARKIGYTDEMSYKELGDLLKAFQAEAEAKEEAAKAEADAEVSKADREKLLAQVEAKEKSEAEAEEKPEEQKAEAKPEAKAEEPLNIDYAKVRCGLSATHDHERRITILERKVDRILSPSQTAAACKS